LTSSYPPPPPADVWSPPRTTKHAERSRSGGRITPKQAHVRTQAHTYKHDVVHTSGAARQLQKFNDAAASTRRRLAAAATPPWKRSHSGATPDFTIRSMLSNSTTGRAPVAAAAAAASSGSSFFLTRLSPSLSAPRRGPGSGLKICAAPRSHHRQPNDPHSKC
jgi:hypothetical protein